MDRGFTEFGKGEIEVAGIGGEGLGASDGVFYEGGELDFFFVFFLRGKTEVGIDGEFSSMYVHRPEW